PDHFEALEATAAGYCSITPFLDEEIALLPDLLLSRWSTTAVISAWRVLSYPENAEYITGWDAGVWAMLDAFTEMGPVAYERRVLEALGAALTSARLSRLANAPVAELTQRRRRLLGSALSPLTY